MKQLCLILAFAASSFLVAQQTPTPKKADAVPMVLLLKNFQIVEGLFERDGKNYVLKQGRESKTFLADDVLVAGTSRDDVRQYLLSHSKDPNKSVPVFQGFNSMATRTYSARMQPLLMNLCVNCHGKPDHMSGFKLLRVPEGYADPSATRKNLETTLKFTNPDDPSNSPLMLKSLQAHGGQKQAAFKDRQILGAQNLEKWLHWASFPEGSAWPEVVPTARPRAVGATAPVAALLPGPLPKSADPFDPAIFNQLIHGNSR